MNVRSTLFAAATCVSLGATGCMTSPLEGDWNQDRDDPVDFHGWAANPNETIGVQILHEDGYWETVEETMSAGWSITWNGEQLYPWEAKAVQLPHNHNYWYHTSEPGFKHACEVRAVDSGGSALFTFDQNYSASAAAGMTGGELWNAAGQGTSVTIYSVD